MPIHALLASGLKSSANHWVLPANYPFTLSNTALSRWDQSRGNAILFASCSQGIAVEILAIAHQIPAGAARVKGLHTPLCRLIMPLFI